MHIAHGLHSPLSTLRLRQLVPPMLRKARPTFRGSFNGWSSPEEHKFRNRCDRLELVTTLRGQHEFGGR